MDLLGEWGQVPRVSSFEDAVEVSGIPKTLLSVDEQGSASRDFFGLTTGSTRGTNGLSEASVLWLGSESRGALAELSQET